METTTPMNAPALTDSPVLRTADVDDAVMVFNQLVTERDSETPKLDVQRIALHTRLPTKSVMHLLWLLQSWGWITYDSASGQVSIIRVTEAQVVGGAEARRIAAEFDMANAHRIRARARRRAAVRMQIAPLGQ